MSTITPFAARPKSTDKEILKKAAETLFEKIKVWDSESSDDPAESASIIDTLTKVIRPDLDGYAIAKRLDSQYGWDVDSDLVEILDDAAHLVREAARVAQEEWYSVNKEFLPTINPNTKIRWNTLGSRHRGVGVAGITQPDGLVRVAFESEGQSVVLPLRSYYTAPVEELVVEQ